MPPARIVGRGFEPDLMADRIVELRRVEPEMRMRETEPAGGQGRAHRGELDRELGIVGVVDGAGDQTSRCG